MTLHARLRRISKKKILFAVFIGLLGFVVASEIMTRRYYNEQYPIEVVHKADKPLGEKEAIIILPGFANSIKGRIYAKEYFSQYPALGYDVLIADFMDPDSLPASVANLKAFMQTHKVEEYRKIHVFCTILGTRVMNRLLTEMQPHNLQTLIYDRNPVHELAPGAFTTEYPTIMEVMFGDIEYDLAKPYEPLQHPENYRIGLIIENRLIEFIRKPVIYGLIDAAYFSEDKYSYAPASFGERYDDFTYVPLNHAEVYFRWDVIGPEVLHFIKHGRFTAQARRTPYEINLWEKRPPTPYQEVDLAAMFPTP